VTGKTSLQLVVTNGGDNLNYDHADWADAKLTCGGSPPPDTTPPTVSGTVPTNGATGVAASVVPSATFSEAIDPATVNATNLTLTNQATSAAVAGSVAWNGTTRTASFTPSTALAAGTSYLARVKGGASGVKDVAGNALAADVTWTFTTASTGGTTSYLSDLAYSVVANGWGPVEKDRSNGEQAAGDGLPLTINGTVYAKGLGTHAVSDIRYTMSGCTVFSATVGVDDEVGNLGSVVFQVFTDGTKVYESAVLTGANPGSAITVDVTGKTSLQLVVTNGGDNLNYDHADWADAKLTCGT
jgi:hypothetical protein